MIRQNQRFLTQLYVLADAACMLLIFIAAFWIKFNSGLFPSAQTLPFRNYFMWGTVYSFISILIGFYVGFYTPRRKKSFSADILKVLQVHSISFLGLLSALYAAKELHISREFLVMFLILDVVFLLSYRYVLKTFLYRVRSKGYNRKYVLILGAGSVGRNFYENLLLHPELGYEVYGFLDDKREEHEFEHQHFKPILGKIGTLEETLRMHPIDEVIIALPLEAHGMYASIIAFCDNAGVKTLIIPDYFDVLPSRPFFDNFAGIPLINVRDIPLDEISNRLLKRTFDIVFSLIALILASPLMLFVVVGIKLTSPGPIIFSQERMGLNRRTFRMYKFRSMRVSDSIISDTKWTIENDPRRTKFGTFLRRTSLDEFPQFFNVLIGDMSVVGPRPERPYFVEQFKDEIPKYMVKHHIRPGITGWAQASGLRGDTSIKDRIDHDLFYLENWSFLFDLKIIWQTIYKGLVNRNAY
ncbi:undecaprenyl-phosphate glucose phosphotransferase [Cohnella candidum]|uniref:Undecaprenyl-phosphate glucose phosphotransferase n=1 Tax=Cohnella candidum TaxID=2674991 RepID=A0A3G3K143_9BACL|nr:undecaprenyl-phosphate glucose phosphotransferase [Cohnella candidum]AYQ74173.1 undecaprenyl-phosphate glucose phosphotransferase [Cohnella candidum]